VLSSRPVIDGPRIGCRWPKSVRSGSGASGRSIVAYIISANARHGLTKCNVKRNLSDRIVRQGCVVGDANQCEAL
jgi:hypothetical protein